MSLESAPGWAALTRELRFGTVEGEVVVLAVSHSARMGGDDDDLLAATEPGVGGVLPGVV